MTDFSPNTNSDAHEKKRLEKLYGYTQSETYERSGIFQHIVGMASHIFNVPFAFVTFVDEDEILLKASVGIEDVASISRDIGLCSFAVLKDEVTVFENAKAEYLLSDNPLVHGPAGLQFYAGAPITTSEGYRIGVVAIADTKPRAFTDEDRQMLESMATLVMEELKN